MVSPLARIRSTSVCGIPYAFDCILHRYGGFKRMRETQSSFRQREQVVQFGIES